jgi:acetyl esterase/lipase
MLFNEMLYTSGTCLRRIRFMFNLAAFSVLGLAVACIALGACAVTPHADTSEGSPPATTRAAQRIHLWEKTPGVVEGKDTDANPTEPTLDIYLADNPTGTAVLVLPGGGYVNLATGHEGKDVATYLNAHQITAFVLRYRHAPRYHNPIPLEDAQRAMRLIRSNAAEYRIDPHRIGVCGFSAGGHLAATLATAGDGPADSPVDSVDRESARPDFAALVYPVITFVDEPYVHKGSRTALVGEDRALWEKMSAEKRVTSSTPPVFLVHAAPDKTVPVENSIMFFEACHKNHVPAELHIFPTGPHGFGMRKDPVLSIWPDLMVHWINTFAAKSAPATSAK